MLAKSIVYFGQQAVLICDNRCDQAWGINSRPTIEDNGLTYYIADGEQEAPRNPGTEEGGCIKPDGPDSLKLNKWCARECERSAITEPCRAFELPVWSTRQVRIQ